MITIIDTLLKQGRGFCFQSQGNEDHPYYNFALYGPKHVPVNNRVSHYAHAYSLSDLVRQIKPLIEDDVFDLDDI